LQAWIPRDSVENVQCYRSRGGDFGPHVCCPLHVAGDWRRSWGLLGDNRWDCVGPKWDRGLLKTGDGMTRRAGDVCAETGWKVADGMAAGFLAVGAWLTMMDLQRWQVLVGWDLVEKKRSGSMASRVEQEFRSGRTRGPPWWAEHRAQEDQSLECWLLL
jgi:hypothetical protein